MKIKTSILGLFVMLTILNCSGSNKSISNIQTQKILLQDKNSDFIFQGKILNDDKINLPKSLRGKNIKLVQVEKVLLNYNEKENLKGIIVQVLIDGKEKYIKGTSYIFYTKTWLFGKKLTVVANKISPIKNVSSIFKKIELTKKNNQEKKLKNKFNKAEYIVVGQVKSVRNVNTKQAVLISEHSPNWKVATLEIQEVLKGKLSKKRIDIFYSNSIDVHWYKSPKLNLGLQGIFILNRKEQFKKTKNNFTITESNEFFPISELKNIKKILTKK